MFEEINLRSGITSGGLQQQLFPYTRTPASSIELEPKGAVYTKRWVVELILDLANYRTENDLPDALAVEPAAGDGAFLGPMIERLVASCSRMGRPIADCGQSLIAFEINESRAERARSFASHHLRQLGIGYRVADDLASRWVRVADYLLESPCRSPNFVIGNPPYVRLEDIPAETASHYREMYGTMRGRADLYVAFFEAALRSLTDRGTCAFICADRWMRNQYGAELRRLVTSGFAVDVIIEMHRADAFHQEVDAYPAITIIHKGPQKTSVIASASETVRTLQPEMVSKLIQAANRGEAVAMPKGLRAAAVDTWFKGSDPWPCHSPGQLALLRRLEERFITLESTARVGIGVATGNDSLFITKDARLVENSRLLKLALSRDITSGETKWSGHYLVNPWDEAGLVDLSAFPQLRAYLELHSAALKKRHTAGKNAEGWYRTIDRVTYPLTSRRKLYIADIKNTLDPVLDRGETYPHHNLYFIESEEWDLEVLGGLLISAFGQFFVESYGVRMRGGYFRFQAQYLRRIRLPRPDALRPSQSVELTEAFRIRDRDYASTIALGLYGIERNEMEDALGY
ncbi:MAG: Eco57I restriction-modification methylase domain-containing protein [Acidobacteriota bacterium]|nr:Eco57I restriction-modification methylase domain-containing protein [Acidobacteriota bacterium]